MPMPAAQIEALIKAAIPDATVEIEALVDDNDHWLARVTSAQFEGKNRVQQQRAVYAALKGKMDGAQGELHALALTTKVPDPA